MTFCFTTNLSFGLLVKVFLKLVNSWQSYGQMVDCFMRPIRLHVCPQICRTRHISRITCVWRTQTVTNCCYVMLCWQANSLDFIINRYQNSVDQFWLTGWQTDAVSDWQTADHVRRFAATAFSLLHRFCTAVMRFLIWPMWTSFC